MGKQEQAMPFGLLFEEAAPAPQGLIEPFYDERKDLSYVEDSQGHRVPYVEFGKIIGTQTATKVYRETTDTDPHRTGFSVVGTTTATRIQTESTDTDSQDDNARFFGNLTTESVTLVQAEGTDTDPGDDQVVHPIRKPLIGTDTLTEVKRESTDKD